VEWCGNEVRPEWIQNLAVQKIFNRRVDLHRTNQWHGISAFLADFDEEKQIITTVATGQLIDPSAGARARARLVQKNQNPSAKQIFDIATKFRNQFIERQMSALMHRANQPELSDDERVQLLKQQQELRELKRRPLPPPT